MSAALNFAPKARSNRVIRAGLAALCMAQLSTSTAALAFDLAAVKKDVQKVIRTKQCGPILIRLAWHDAGTFDAASGTGGPRACMRFAAGESTHGANNGLAIARGLLEPVKQAHPGIGHADLWSLAGAMSVKEMGGPTVHWRPGRVDATSEEACVEEGRLPDAQQKGSHLRSVFYRMGWKDQEIVALSGAHAVGGFHKDRSGHEGDWSVRKYNFDNSYFQDLLSENWAKYTNDQGVVQYKCALGTTMAPSDVALVEDPQFRPWTQLYAEDQDRFFLDFSSAMTRLMELGVPAFHQGTSSEEIDIEAFKTEL